MDALSQHLKQLRNARGLSIRKAAQSLGISPTSLRNYETGRDSKGNVVNPKRAVLLKMAKVYDFPTSVLLSMANLPIDEPEPVFPDQVELDAQEVAEIFRRLPEVHRSMFLGIARTYHALALAQQEREVPSEAEDALQDPELDT